MFQARLTLIVIAAFLPGPKVLGEAPRLPSPAPLFERDIQPFFEQHCTECHGHDSTKADLDLRSLAALLRGGESGEVVSPGNAHGSSLFEKVKSGEMPPKKRTKLTTQELGLLEAWINAGARGQASDVPPDLSKAEKNARKVYDILELKCLPCHNGKKQEGQLDLRTVPSMVKGGKNGTALVKGTAEQSLLVKKIVDDAMPPRDQRNNASIKPITTGELDLIRQWISDGAVEPPAIPLIPDNDFAQISDKDRSWWSFQPPRQAPIPAVQNKKRIRTPIDDFLLAKLEEEKLSFSREADPRTLARRAYLQITGLPPTPEQLEEFLRDKKADAYERLVDTLLASPRYAERWAQSWLDAAGYADSEGAVDDDPIWEEFWRYRDYVIRSLNANKPFDRFLLEQLAGDELHDYRNVPEMTPELVDSLIATGFLRGGVDPTMNAAMNFVPDRHQVLADKIEMIGSTLMGLTLHCARCHSHKYDPVSQRDYYRLSAVFGAAYSPMDWRKPNERYLPLATSAQQDEITKHNAALDAEKKQFEQPLETLRKKHKADLLEQKIAALADDIKKQLRELSEIPAEKRTDAQKELAVKYAAQLKAEDKDLADAFPDFKTKSEGLNASIAELEGRKRKFDRAFGLTDVSAEPPRSYFHRRGDPFDRAGEVKPNIPAVLSSDRIPYKIEPPSPGRQTSGRRLAFARWLVHPENPLTARVTVNRIWQQYFGKGIVETVENFGHTGSPPTHPELLDWLAVEFVKEGWNLKKLHKLILTSTAFRQQSRSSEAGTRIDPENKLLWRMPLMRMDAEVLRDATLACSGDLRDEMYGPPAKIAAKADGQIVAKNEPANLRRSIYTLHRRSRPITMLETYDAPQLTLNCTRRRISNVVSQPLFMLNSEFMAEQSSKLAARLEKEAPQSVSQKIIRAYELLVNRSPSRQEIQMGVKFLKEQSAAYATGKESRANSAEREALIDFCLVLFNTAEFLYVN